MSKPIRVQLHPATDAWAMGDRYGEVIATKDDGTFLVLMDKSKRRYIVKPEDILEWL